MKPLGGIDPADSFDPATGIFQSAAQRAQGLTNASFGTTAHYSMLARALMNLFPMLGQGVPTGKRTGRPFDVGGGGIFSGADPDNPMVMH